MVRIAMPPQVYQDPILAAHPILQAHVQNRYIKTPVADDVLCLSTKRSSIPVPSQGRAWLVSGALLGHLLPLSMKLKRSTYTGAFSKANPALQGILGLVGNEASEDLQDLLAHKARGSPWSPSAARYH
ncbi:hypothetical protein D1P53_004222 [Cryptococcus gattii VGV]|nr:hypothetical protein D1P53_004222 [Cryptococcus gattii VGV]